MLELVEGETLAERIARRATATSAGLPVKEALSFARQIADALETAHEKGIGPQVLPDGRGVLYTVLARDLGVAKITIYDLQTNTSTDLLTGGSHAMYLRSGHLVYVAGGALWAVPFDAGRRIITARPCSSGSSWRQRVRVPATLPYPRAARLSTRTHQATTRSPARSVGSIAAASWSHLTRSNTRICNRGSLMVAHASPTHRHRPRRQHLGAGCFTTGAHACPN